MPLAFGLKEPPRSRRHGAAARASARALREAFRLPQLPAADGGLLRLRLPGRLHRRAHAQLPEGPRPDARGGHHGAGADRPVQRDRHLRRGHAGPAPGQAPHPGRHLHPALGGHRGLPARRR